MKLRPFSRAAALMGIAAFGLSGCAYFNPMQTHHFYQPAEGALINFTPEGASKPVGVRNLLAVKDANGVKVTGALVNQSSQDYTVDLNFVEGVSGSASINVPAGETIMLGGDGAEAVQVTTSKKPGDNLFVDVTVGNETQRLTVQLLDESLEYLAPEK
ncbi:hypothetical protein M3B90_01810 [Dermabacter sp. p3-SID358]|uniref:hypothetical protein n=1 Tax=Dermabacter sp. p3-SID358 TaxID=2916114 RepID=UPI0021A625CD|nr:hypothetical protein [Dermabacter sp. p3-SID358]MCT1866270.1 hypothetical protein [Dermabacter sp. p3-SID358]